MLEYALGLIETRGLIGAIEAADAATKAADVKLIGRERADAGLVTIKLIGDVAAIRSAVDAGAAAAQRVGELISAHVIPRPDDSTELLIYPPLSQTKEKPEYLSIQEPSVEPLQKKIRKSRSQPQPTIVEEPPPQQALAESTVVETPQQTMSDDEVTYRQQLDEMTVHEMRRYARGISGLSIYGRQISRANKDELIIEIIMAKFSKL